MTAASLDSHAAWQEPPEDFRYILFERIDPEDNAYRYYYISWQQTLFGWGIVRFWGRKGETQQTRIDHFDSLVQAWPTIRGHIRDRINHGYHIVSKG